MSTPLVLLLGAVGVRRDDGSLATPPRLDGLVLAHLALAEGRTLTVDDLIDAIWQDRPPDQARNALQVKVSRLRGLLGERGRALTYSPGGYRLDLTTQDTDAGCFAEEVRAAQALVHTDPEAASAVLDTALARWQGEALADLGDHPRLVAARSRLGELRMVAAETLAECLLARPESRARGIAELRGVLDAEPLRPRARVMLMEALDASGRRAEALAAYDAGRRLYAHAVGLEPPDELRVVFERLLAAEREATRRAAATTAERGVPEGLAATARWVADDGDVDAALSLALRGTWWWWMSGQRSLGRDLLADLVERARSEATPVDGRAVLSARAWTWVYETLGPDATAALEQSRKALEVVGRRTWNRHDCLAATLVAERLFERGDHEPAGQLLGLAAREQARRGDEWGQAFCAVVGARGLLRSGDLAGARARAEAQLRRFLSLGDLAGQVTCLDVIGYCAEAMGELGVAAQAHSRAIALARRAGAREWEAGHLVRLGNVGVLAERPDAVADLTRAYEVSATLGAHSVTAYCHNGLGVADAFAGDVVAAAERHRAAYAWYEKAGSTSGMAYSGARIAMTTSDPGPATDSLRAALRTADPRAVAHSLEAVALTTDDRDGAARALGAAAALRAASADRLAHPQLRVLRRRREELTDDLGGPVYDGLAAEGAAAPLAEAARW